ncbi:MAG: FKBP-type peptidyl-prolyl cis-trans isomerase [Halobacteria archaeon]|nr:FKBP-type peptidyl-prolyl cis-trans isomerase [Halobacteria archaeon]
MCIAAEAVAPQSESHKAIYSLGYELGTELKAHALDFDQELLLQGINDAIDGNKPLVKTTGRNRALAQIRQQRAQRNLEQSQAFLAENAKKKGVVTLDSGLQYRVIKAGEGNSPQATESVSVNYRGTLIDGTEFDSAYEPGKPVTFQVKKVIKGWREALPLMKEGGKWELYIPPELAYGKRAPRKTIPPNSALIYEVELIAVK